MWQKELQFSALMLAFDPQSWELSSPPALSSHSKCSQLNLILLSLPDLNSFGHQQVGEALFPMSGSPSLGLDLALGKGRCV